MTKEKALEIGRDLLLLFVAGVITAFFGLGVGVTALTTAHLMALVDAGAAALVTGALLYLTPITRRYGVGAQTEERVAKHRKEAPQD
jgi:hypothetical protein